MADRVNWHLEILPPEQRALWDSRISRGFSGWVLYGGTALALRLGHRRSVDFDFFSAQPLSPLEFSESQKLDGRILQAAPNSLSLLHRGVKLSFFGGLTLRVIRTPDFLEHCPVASIEDLAACKLAALVNRVELKDYLDVLAILRHGMRLEEMLGCAAAVYRGNFPVAACLKSLTWFEPTELSVLSKEDRQLLEKSALEVESIPEVIATPYSIGEV
ncbi:MAG: nucleotidyl transferase AbiEii/AbiGii toxin family protein [Verrucomicrobiota bacterium]